MPSYSQLELEPWWGREIVTDELDWLGDELCRRTGRPRDAFGSKGNNVHLSGGHRSQEWLKNSDWCTNRNYTAQSGLTAAQLRHIAAFDWTPGNWGTSSNRALMVTHTKALFAAARSGQLNGMRQIFGTLDGRTAIGLNVLTLTLTYPDDSHVEHLHGTFDRTRMRDIALMARIADIITGDDMSWTENLTAGADAGGKTYPAKDWLIGTNMAAWNTYNRLGAFVAAEETRDAAMLAAITALSAGGGVEAAPIIAAIQAEAAATRALVEEKHNAEMAELRRAHDAEKAGLVAELERLNAADS